MRFRGHEAWGWLPVVLSFRRGQPWCTSHFHLLGYPIFLKRCCWLQGEIGAQHSQCCVAWLNSIEAMGSSTSKLMCYLSKGSLFQPLQVFFALQHLQVNKTIVSSGGIKKERCAAVPQQLFINCRFPKRSERGGNAVCDTTWHNLT